MQPDLFDWDAFISSQNAFASKDWPAFKNLRARYVASVPSETRAIWKLCRKTMPNFHLGRAEFLPIRKGEGAISQYIGKYLEAGMQIRIHAWKGCRRVERDRRTATLWNRHHRQFSWVSPGATIWRKRLSELASALGITDFDGFKTRYGPRWAYHLRERILLATDQKWPEFLSIVTQLRFTS